MLRTIYSRLVRLAAAGAAFSALAHQPLAAGDLQLGCIHCPHCQACCTLKAEQVDEERSCWEVECEEICIPRVVFPWQKDCCNPCANNGAVVRKVKRLKSKTYSCPACEYTWEPSASHRRPCGCGACQHCQSGSGCGDAACDVTCADAALPVAPMPSPPLPQPRFAPENPPAPPQPAAALPVHVQPFYGQPVYAQPAWPQGAAAHQPIIAAPQGAAYP